MLINLQTSAKCINKISKSICETTSQNCTKIPIETEWMILILMLEKLWRSIIKYHKYHKEGFPQRYPFV